MGSLIGSHPMRSAVAVRRAQMGCVRHFASQHLCVVVACAPWMVRVAPVGAVARLWGLGVVPLWGLGVPPQLLHPMIGSAR